MTHVVGILVHEDYALTPAVKDQALAIIPLLYPITEYATFLFGTQNKIAPPCRP